MGADLAKNDYFEDLRAELILPSDLNDSLGLLRDCIPIHGLLTGWISTFSGEIIDVSGRTLVRSGSLNFLDSSYKWTGITGFELLSVNKRSLETFVGADPSR